MLYFLASKVLSFVINPCVWLLVLIILAIFKKTHRLRYLYLLLTLVLILGNTYLTNLVIGAWEKDQYASRDTLSKYETFIILGGYNEWNKYTLMQDCNAAGDRLFNMLPFLHDSTKTIIITGGSGRLNQPKLKEADITQRYLLQIPSSAHIVYENQSRNTKENLIYSKKIVDSLQLQNVCVVGSALHLRRTSKLLHTQKIDWNTAGVESTRELNPTPLDIILPKANNIHKWYNILHEWIGYLVA